MTLETQENSFLSSIGVLSIQELSISNAIIREFPLTSWSLADGYIASGSQATYTTTLSNSLSTRINVTIQWIKDGLSTEIFNQTMNIAPQTLKYTIALSAYSFFSSINRLRVVMDGYVGTIETSDTICMGGQSSDDNENDITWLKLRMNQHALYSRYLKLGLVDGRVVRLVNSLINKTLDVANQQTFYQVGITLPHYISSSLIDPDFQLIIDPTIGQSNQPGDLCASQDRRKRFIKALTIALPIVGFCILVAITVFLCYKGLAKLVEGSNPYEDQQELILISLNENLLKSAFTLQDGGYVRPDKDKKKHKKHRRDGEKKKRKHREHGEAGATGSYTICHKSWDSNYSEYLDDIMAHGPKGYYYHR
eukprot:gene19562-23434_t